VKKRLSVLFTILLALTLAYPSFAETASSAGSNNNALYFEARSNNLQMSPGVNVGTQPFTFETYFKTGPKIDYGFFLGVSGGNGMSINIHSANEIQIDAYGINATVFVLSSALQVNTWHHIAVARDANNDETVWVDGVRAVRSYNRWNNRLTYGAVYRDSRNYGGQAGGINISTACGHCNDGLGDASTNDFAQFRITNYRIVVGSTVYDPNNSTITLPTAPLANITNTKVLLNVTDSSSFLTDSSGNQTITNSSVVFRAADTTTPSAPTSLTAIAGDGQATISFTPGSNGGSAITNYEFSTDGTTYRTLSPAGSSSPITIPGLTNGTNYTIYLKAVNAVGVSAASSSVTVTPSTTPSAPASLTATAGNGQATISFTAGSNGGSAITNYEFSTDGTNYSTLSPADSSSPVTISGLTNGTSYNIYLKAVNAVGVSAASSAVTVTPSTTPSAPTSLSATAGDGQATISFTPGSDGGSAITNYEHSTDGTNYTALSPADTSSPITITGLTNGTSYTIYLKAVNANGVSSASSSVSVIPIQPPVSSSDSSDPVGFFEPIRKVELRKQKISWEPNNRIIISKYDSGTKKTSIFESVQGEFILQKANPGQTVYYSIMATDGTVLKNVTMKTKPNTPKIAKVASQKSQLLTINNKTAITAQWKKDKSVKKYNIKITLDNGKILAFTTTDPNVNLVIDETKGATITITAVGKNNLTSTVTRKI